jgi:hypothetical protein
MSEYPATRLASIGQANMESGPPILRQLHHAGCSAFYILMAQQHVICGKGSELRQGRSYSPLSQIKGAGPYGLAHKIDQGDQAEIQICQRPLGKVVVDVLGILSR